jgi:hypothetical protein
MTVCCGFLVGPGYLSRCGDSLWAGQSVDGIPVGERFFAPGPGAHPDSYIMGTRSSSGAKLPGRGVDYPPNLETRLKKRL